MSSRMTNGPEFQHGWRNRLQVAGLDVTVNARHASRSVVPSGGELMRQAARGRPFHPVQRTTYEWAVHLDRSGLRCTVRPTPSGRFEIAGTQRVHDTLDDAVRAWAESAEARMVARPDPSEPEPPDTGGGPRP